MARYIDVDIAVKEAIKACNKLFREKGEILTSLDAVEIAEALDEIPTADVEEVKYGKWRTELDEFDWNKNTCTHCGYVKRTDIHVSLGWKFCPNCGAKMDGGRENDGKG